MTGSPEAPDAPPTLVLASTSPSRLSILRSAGVEPRVDPSSVDEDAVVASLNDPSPADVVAALAAAKAREVAQRWKETPGALVLGGDSLLLLDGELQGKPHTPERALERWEMQRGRAAELLTGHALIEATTGRWVSETTRTRLNFADADLDDLRAYVATGEPLACAGAFTLEARGGWFVDAIDGDPSSVIGLSLPALRRLLRSLGVRVADLWAQHPAQ